jgi:hypothetical protein
MAQGQGQDGHLYTLVQHTVYGTTIELWHERSGYESCKQETTCCRLQNCSFFANASAILHTIVEKIVMASWYEYTERPKISFTCYKLENHGGLLKSTKLFSVWALSMSSSPTTNIPAKRSNVCSQGAILHTAFSQPAS